MKKTMLMAFAILFLAGGLFSACDSNPAENTNTDTTAKEAAGKEVAKVQYTCSMHPEVLTDKPGKCPKCGMTLVEKTHEK